MKRILSIVLAAMLLFTVSASTSVLADSSAKQKIFDLSLELLNNEPTTAEDEYGDEYNVWEVIDSNTVLKVGDTVTFRLSYAIPEAIDGFTAEELECIEFLITANGVDELEVVEASGCDPKFECDYEAGFCRPLEGYGNVSVDGNICTVYDTVDANVSIVFTGKVSAKDAGLDIKVTIGQYRFPAIFSVGTVTKEEIGGAPTYNVHRSSTSPVQKRAMEFRNGMGYVGLNNHYYILEMDEDLHMFTEVDADFNPTDNVVCAELDETIGAALLDIYTEYTTFFNITSFAEVNDETFLGGYNHSTSDVSFTLGGSADVDPVKPDNPKPPATGAVSLAAIGVIAILGGATLTVTRKNK